MAGNDNFDRQYRMAAGPAGGIGFKIGETSKTQPVPLHIDFSLQKSDLETQNTGRVTVWNLNKSQLAVLNEADCCVSLRAGYGNRLPLIFAGIVSYDAYTVYSAYNTSQARAVNNNTEPTITCSSASGSDLGTKTAGFSVSYSVNDIDGDTVTVTEAIDGVAKRTFTATLGTTNTFAVTGDYFMQVLNGKHTMTITANDGKATTTHTLTFTKSITAASITLEAPMDADAQITLAVLSVIGFIPSDADYKVELTNNAKDPSPVWEDCTSEVKLGANHIFTNQTAANGFAFNFRITVARGSSGEGGYISSVQGGFQ